MAAVYWILCFVIAAIPAFLLYRKDKTRPIAIKWLPALLRFLTVFFTAALLLSPAFPKHTTVEEKPVILWLQDASSSINIALKNDSTAYRKKVQQLWQQKNLPFQFKPLSFGAKLRPGVDFKYHASATDIANGLQQAERRYKHQNIGAIVVASDGNFNQGSNPLYALDGHRIPIYTIALGDSTTPRDLSVSFVRANKTVALHNNFEIMVTVLAQKLNRHSATIKITHHHQTLAQQTFEIHGGQYSRTFHFDIPATEKGLQRYSISVSPIAGEQNSHNNHKAIFVNVLKRKIKIFVASDGPHPDIAAIKQALSRHPEYQITIKYGHQIPPKIQDVDLLITHNLPGKDGIRIPKHAQIPVWYMVGAQTNLAAFSKIIGDKDISKSSRVTDVLPKLNTTFSLFSLPKNIRQVTAILPPLEAYPNVITTAGTDPLFNQNENPSKPLWSINSGQTPYAILWGTGLWRWRLHAFQNFQQTGAIDALIQGTIRVLTSRHNGQAFRIFTDKSDFRSGEPIVVHARLHNAVGANINSPDAKLWITDSSGQKTSYVFSKTGHSYQANLGRLPQGIYAAKASVTFGGNDFRDSIRFVVSKISVEQLKQYSNDDILYKLAHHSGGQFYTENDFSRLVNDLKSNDSIKPIIRQETRYPNWIDLKWYFIIILISATAEWLLRKYWGL